VGSSKYVPVRAISAAVAELERLEGLMARLEARARRVDRVLGHYRTRHAVAAAEAERLIARYAAKRDSLATTIRAAQSSGVLHGRVMQSRLRVLQSELDEAELSAIEPVKVRDFWGARLSSALRVSAPIYDAVRENAAERLKCREFIRRGQRARAKQKKRDEAKRLAEKASQPATSIPPDPTLKVQYEPTAESLAAFRGYPATIMRFK
jgi:hypothetical protein